MKVQPFGIILGSPPFKDNAITGASRLAGSRNLAHEESQVERRAGAAGCRCCRHWKAWHVDILSNIWELHGNYYIDFINICFFRDVGGWTGMNIQLWCSPGYRTTCTLPAWAGVKRFVSRTVPRPARKIRKGSRATAKPFRKVLPGHSSSLFNFMMFWYVLYDLPLMFCFLSQKRWNQVSR